MEARYSYSISVSRWYWRIETRDARLQEEREPQCGRRRLVSFLRASRWQAYDAAQDDRPGMRERLEFGVSATSLTAPGPTSRSRPTSYYTQLIFTRTSSCSLPLQYPLVGYWLRLKNSKIDEHAVGLRRGDISYVEETMRRHILG